MFKLFHLPVAYGGKQDASSLHGYRVDQAQQHDNPTVNMFFFVTATFQLLSFQWRKMEIS
jgi:hypothetical protein